MTTKRKLATTTTAPVRPDPATGMRVERAYEKALKMMKEAGFGINAPVEVVVDPQLPFMGYTVPQGRSFRIVVSGGAVESGLLEGLLVHEMSHIYRMQANHPSHNAEVIEEAINSLGRRALSQDYQQKIVHDLLNDIQDLYADDIAFTVLRKTPVFASAQMSSFLQDWVKDQPVKSGDARRNRWVNTSIMAHNARALAQMTRHRVEDISGKAARRNERFLAGVDPTVAEQFEYFRNVLTNLKEDVTTEDYRRLLAAYLGKFLEVAEKN